MPLLHLSVTVPYIQVIVQLFYIQRHCDSDLPNENGMQYYN
jgi:hypothetical protein